MRNFIILFLVIFLLVNSNAQFVFIPDSTSSDITAQDLILNADSTFYCTFFGNDFTFRLYGKYTKTKAGYNLIYENIWGQEYQYYDGDSLMISYRPPGSYLRNKSNDIELSEIDTLICTYLDSNTLTITFHKINFIYRLFPDYQTYIITRRYLWTYPVLKSDNIFPDMKTGKLYREKNLGRVLTIREIVYVMDMFFKD